MALFGWATCSPSAPLNLGDGDGERERERETDRQTDGRTDGQTDRRTDRDMGMDKDVDVFFGGNNVGISIFTHAWQ